VEPFEAPHGRIVAPLEALAIFLAHFERDVRAPILVAVVYIPNAVILKVAFGSLNAVEVASVFELLKRCRRRCVRANAILRGRWRIPILR
jgi:hypothetical protein